MKWMLNSKGAPDAMLTLGVVSLGVVLLKFFFSEISIGPVIFGQLDGLVVASILTPTLGAYVARRYSDNATQSKDKTDDKAN